MTRPCMTRPDKFSLSCSCECEMSRTKVPSGRLRGKHLTPTRCTLGHQWVWQLPLNFVFFHEFCPGQDSCSGLVLSIHGLAWGTIHPSHNCGDHPRPHHVPTSVTVDTSHTTEGTGRENVVTITVERNGQVPRRSNFGDGRPTGKGTPRTVAQPRGLWKWVASEGASTEWPVVHLQGVEPSTRLPQLPRCPQIR